MSGIDTSPTPTSIPKHIVLVGLMGSGKSSVGRHLAAQLDREFVDTDKKVEALAGKSVRDIFLEDGEDNFRLLETKVVQQVLKNEKTSVIAAAGGVVTRSDNRDALLRSRNAGQCVVVWLRANTDELLQRVQKGVHRPLLDNDPRGTLASMEETRTPMYEEVASVIVDTDGLNIEQVTQLVLTMLERAS